MERCSTCVMVVAQRICVVLLLLPPTSEAVWTLILARVGAGSAQLRDRISHAASARRLESCAQQSSVSSSEKEGTSGKGVSSSSFSTSWTNSAIFSFASRSAVRPLFVMV
jgi:hypothetical protein